MLESNLREYVKSKRRQVHESPWASFTIASPELGLARSLLKVFLRKKGPMTHAGLMKGKAAFVKRRPGLEAPETRMRRSG